MMNKTLTSILLAAGMSLTSLTSCGGNNAAPTPSKTYYIQDYNVDRNTARVYVTLPDGQNKLLGHVMHQLSPINRPPVDHVIIYRTLEKGSVPYVIERPANSWSATKIMAPKR